MTFMTYANERHGAQKWVLSFPRIVAVGWWSPLAAFQYTILCRYSGSVIVDHQYILVSAPAVQMSFSHGRKVGTMRIQLHVLEADASFRTASHGNP